MSVQIQEHLPVRDLRPYVQRFWSGRFGPLGGSSLAQRVLPSGHLELIVHLTDLHCDLPSAAGWGQSPDYTLIGLQSQPYEVRFSGDVEVFAVRFKPAGFCTLFGVPVADLVDTHEDLLAVLGPRFDAFAAGLREADGLAARLRLAERTLLRAAESREATYLNHAAELIRSSGGTLRVAHVAERLCISARQLERAFRQTLGLTPKQYLRIARLGTVWDLLQSGDHHGLADVAYRAGYADQAHLTRDLKGLIGVQPGRLAAESDAYAASGTFNVNGQGGSHLALPGR
jgi:AraC-like DNA-binding protein